MLWREKRIIIGYGNWGKNPNRKGSAPTPGIGIRRRIEKRFKSITTNEHFTSQTDPISQKVKVFENPKVGKDQQSRRHLLRCTNVETPCRWGNRNVVGSYNILRRFLGSLKQSIVVENKADHLIKYLQLPVSEFPEGPENKCPKVILKPL